MLGKSAKRVGNCSIEEVYELMDTAGDQGVVPFRGYDVKINSKRLQVFRSNPLVCSSCELVASHFGLDIPINVKNPHLNLYGMKDGAEVLFTRDHTIDRADGGADTLDNQTVMCSPCNFEKSVVTREERFQRLIMSSEYTQAMMAAAPKKKVSCARCRGFFFTLRAKGRVSILTRRPNETQIETTTETESYLHRKARQLRRSNDRPSVPANC
jgi:5-methylcytosine-specific restriction endonuclease McrA